MPLELRLQWKTAYRRASKQLVSPKQTDLITSKPDNDNLCSVTCNAHSIMITERRSLMYISSYTQMCRALKAFN